MSTSIDTELELHPIATKSQDRNETNEKDLNAGCFYWTNAGFPKELDHSKDEYTKSPLRSFDTLPLSRLLPEREPLRVSIDTTIRHENINGGKKGSKKRGKYPLNYKRPCYLAKYDEFTKHGVIFLGTSKKPVNTHRFVIVQSRPSILPLQSGSLGTVPPFSFKEEKTYLNISHPLQVQLEYLPIDKFPHTKKDGIPYDGHKPPLVSIGNFATQSSDVCIPPNKKLKTSILFDKKSEQLFWERHKEYHRDRPGRLELHDDSGRDDSDGDDSNGDDSNGDDSGGAGLGGTGPSTSGAGPNVGGVGPSASGIGPSAGGVGPNIGGARSSTSGTGPSTSGTGLSVDGWFSHEAKDIPLGQVGDQCVDINIPLMTKDTYLDSNEEWELVKFIINCDANDAPWGRVEDQRTGIDIPLVTEDIYSDSDEEMEETDSEELMINSDANDAPWGQVGDQRIGIDIPLVTEDIYSNSNEETELESDEELEEVDNFVNIGKPESSSSIDITIGPNFNDNYVSWINSCTSSSTIPERYFVISIPCKKHYILLHYEHSARVWRWKQGAPKGEYIVVSIEGLIYERPYIPISISDYLFPTVIAGRRPRRVMNHRTKKHITLPPSPHCSEPLNLDNVIVGMIVDTSIRPPTFKVIESNDKGTIIYDSTTNSWTYRLSVRPQLNKHRPLDNANVASYKDLVYIIDSHDQIVLYDTEQNKWECVLDPTERFYEQLCGIGSWDDRVFSFIHCLPQYGMAFEIREFVGMANPEWKKFDFMPREIYAWLIYGTEVYHDFRIDVSYCSENLLIWVWFDSSAKRFVLCNLAHKTWEKLELPFFTSTDTVPFPAWTDHESWLMNPPSTDLKPTTWSMDSALDKGKGKDK